MPRKRVPDGKSAGFALRPPGRSPNNRSGVAPPPAVLPSVSVPVPPTVAEVAATAFAAGTKEIRGVTTPRLRTEPLVSGPPGPCGCGCALTDESSLGFEAADFAYAVCGVTLVPWQRWWLIHALELRGGIPRFRTVLTLVGRQQGKTFLMRIVTLYMMYLAGYRDVIGSAHVLSVARECWSHCATMIRDVPHLYAEVHKIRDVGSSEMITLTNGARYRIVSTSVDSARGLSADLLIMDELRQQQSWRPWSALTKTAIARPNAMILGFSNAGDDQSVVLNAVRGTALSGVDDSLGIFEWSGDDGCAIDDESQWAQACPSLGYGLVTMASIRSASHSDPPAVFRTEVLCQRVGSLDAAVDVAAWSASADPEGSLHAVRDRVVVCLDVSGDGAHVSLVGAAVMPDTRVRVEVIRAWESVPDCAATVADLIASVRPAAIGFLPGGPAAALATVMRELGAEEVRGAAVSESCQELAALVSGGMVRHGSDPMLTAHILGTSRRSLPGGGWVFGRRAAGYVDGAFAAAGAVRLARTLPAPETRTQGAVY